MRAATAAAEMVATASVLLEEEVTVEPCLQVATTRMLARPVSAAAAAAVELIPTVVDGLTPTQQGGTVPMALPWEAMEVKVPRIQLEAAVEVVLWVGLSSFAWDQPNSGIARSTEMRPLEENLARVEIPVSQAKDEEVELVVMVETCRLTIRFCMGIQVAQRWGTKICITF